MYICEPNMVINSKKKMNCISISYIAARHIIAGLKTRLPLLPTAVNQERLHVTLDVCL